MLQKEITVQFINQPKEGSTYGSIKTSEGEFFGCDKAMLSRFTQGEVCKIEYSEKPKADGQGTWKSVKKKMEIPRALARPMITPRQAIDPKDQEHIFVRLICEKKIDKDTEWTECADIIKNAKHLFKMAWGESLKQDVGMQDQIPDWED